MGDQIIGIQRGILFSLLLSCGRGGNSRHWGDRRSVHVGRNGPLNELTSWIGGGQGRGCRRLNGKVKQGDAGTDLRGGVLIPRDPHPAPNSETRQNFYPVGQSLSLVCGMWNVVTWNVVTCGALRCLGRVNRGFVVASWCWNAVHSQAPTTHSQSLSSGYCFRIPGCNCLGGSFVMDDRWESGLSYPLNIPEGQDVGIQRRSPALPPRINKPVYSNAVPRSLNPTFQQLCRRPPRFY
jgi:hypothetical protein